MEWYRPDEMLTKSQSDLNYENVRKIEKLVEKTESDDLVMNQLEAFRQYTDINVNVEALAAAANEGKLSLVQRLIQEGAGVKTGGAGGNFTGSGMNTEVATPTGASVNTEGAHSAGASVNTDGANSTETGVSTEGANSKGTGVNTDVADVNALSFFGDTALIRASKEGHYSCMQALIEAGADVNKCDSSGSSPLRHTAWIGKYDCLELLVNKGADVNMADFYDDSPLMAAARNQNPACVAFLIQAGADVNMKDDLRRTVLLRETYDGNLGETIDMLLRAGADVNTRDDEGRTPLMYTAYRGSLKYVSRILDAGADVNDRNREGETALLWAAVGNDGHSSGLACVKRLLSAGSVINTEAEVLPSRCTSGDTRRLLIAAGQRFHGDLENLTLEDAAVEPLKHICREAIRNHLLHLDPQKHLFGKVPQLGLPPSLTQYLLYGMSLSIGETQNQ